MKRKTLGCLLSAEAGLLIALTVLTDSLPTAFSSLMSFPFEQIGNGLRALSLTGGLGNGLALSLLCGLSLLPAVPAMRHWRDRTRRAENAALIATAVTLFFVLAGMANPAGISGVVPLAGETGLSVIKAVMGGTVWSLIVCAAVLAMLRLFKAGGVTELYRYTGIMLCGLCALFVGAAVISCVGELFRALADIQRPMDLPMAFIRFAADALPYAMDIAVTLSALTLLETLLDGRRDAARDAAEKLSRLCCVSLGLVTASSAALNVIQLAAAKSLSNISASVNIPLTSLAFTLAALLLSRLISENGRLADENEAFI